MAEERIAVVVTSRDEPGATTSLLQALEARGCCARVPLRPLTAAEVDAMTAECSGGGASPQVRATVRRRTGGVPLLVEELLAPGTDVESTVPATVAGLTTGRLAGLSSGTRRCLEAAAVLGEQFDWRILSAVLDGQDVLGALREAAAAGLVDAVSSNDFRFHHVLGRDAVLRAVLRPEQVDWARRGLAAVVAAHPALDGVWCEVVADLAVRADDDRRAVDVLVLAGRRNLAGGALASAEAVLERARALAGSDTALAAEVDDALAEILVQAGKLDGAAAAAGRSVDRLRSRRAPDAARAQAHLRLARVHVAAGAWEAADLELRQARAHAVDDASRLRAELVAARVALGDSRFEDARTAAEHAVARAGGHPDLADVTGEALLVLGRVARRRDLAAAEEHFVRAQQVADRAGLRLVSMRASEELAIDDVQESLRTDRLHEARTRAAAHGDIAAVAVLDLQMIATYLSRWEIGPALAAADRCITASRRFALPTLPKGLVLGAVAADWVGRAAEADAAYEEAGRLDPDDNHLRGEIRGARAYRALARPDDSRALEQLQQAMRCFAARPNEVTGSPVVGLWVLVSTAVDPGTAAAPAPPDPVANRWNRGMTRFAEAVARGRHGDATAAERAFAEADAILREPVDIAWFRLQARRLVSAAALADGWGSPAEWAAEDLRLLAGRGQDRWETALRGLIRRAGGTVPRRGRGDAAVPPSLQALGVTSRETDVLLLVAEGLTNRDVAERLFVSPRTVEKHVERLMAKTGTRHRAELVAFAARRPESGGSAVTPAGTGVDGRRRLLGQ